MPLSLMASESTDHFNYYDIFVFRVWLLDEELANYSAVLMIVR